MLKTHKHWINEIFYMNKNYYGVEKHIINIIPKIYMDSASYSSFYI